MKHTKRKKLYENLMHYAFKYTTGNETHIYGMLESADENTIVFKTGAYVVYKSSSENTIHTHIANDGKYLIGVSKCMNYTLEEATKQDLDGIKAFIRIDVDCYRTKKYNELSEFLQTNRCTKEENDLWNELLNMKL